MWACLFALLVVPMTVAAQDSVKNVTVTGVGYHYYPQTGELNSVHWSVSHRLPQSVTAITFGLTFRNPNGVVLKTDRHRQAFRYEHQSKTYGEALRRDDVYQVKYHLNVHGFCNGGKCGNVQIRVLEVQME